MHFAEHRRAGPPEPAQIIRRSPHRPAERDHGMGTRALEVDPGDRTPLPQQETAVLKPRLQAWTFGNRAHARVRLSMIRSEEKRHAGSSRRIQSALSSGASAQPQGGGQERITDHKLLSARSPDFFNVYAAV